MNEPQHALAHGDESALDLIARTSLRISPSGALSDRDRLRRARVIAVTKRQGTILPQSPIVPTTVAALAPTGVLAARARGKIPARERQRHIVHDPPRMGRHDDEPRRENSASSTSCVIKKNRRRESSDHRSSNKVCIDSRVNASSAPKGSSSSMTAGEAAIARATPTRCRMPPESS